MKLAIGVPIVDDVPGEAYQGHIVSIIEASQLLGPGNIELITPMGASPHDCARNIIVREAIRLGCNRLFFMDADTITPRGGITQFMEIMDQHDDKPVAVSGFYCRRGGDYSSVWTLQKEDTDGKLTTYSVDAGEGVHRIHVSGLGSCLLDLDWMVKNLPQPWFRMKQVELFTIITDDVVLFEGIQKAGGVVLGDANVQCAHAGRREYITRDSGPLYNELHKVLRKKNQETVIETVKESDFIVSTEKDNANGDSRSESVVS